MCIYCETAPAPLPAADFLASRPQAPHYRCARVCLWQAFIAAQPPGTPPADTKRELYRQVTALPGVHEERTAGGRFFVGISPM